MSRRTKLELYWRAKAAWITEDATVTQSDLQQAKDWCDEVLGQEKVVDPDTLFDCIQMLLLFGRIADADSLVRRSGAVSNASEDVRRIAAFASEVASDVLRTKWWNIAQGTADDAISDGTRIRVGVSDVLITAEPDYRGTADAQLAFLEAIDHGCSERQLRLQPTPQSFFGHPAIGSSRGPSLSYHTRGLRPGTLHWKEGYLPGFFVLDELGYAGWSVASEDQRLAHGRGSEGPSRRAELHDRFSRRGLTKYEQKGTPYEGADGFILLALQVEGDEVEALSYRPPLDFYHDVIAAARAAGYKIVLKPHPIETSDRYRSFLKRAVQSDESVIISDAPINDLLARSFAVCTVNSGVGFEALLHGKPVITGGHSDYHWATTVARDSNDLRVALNRIQEEPADVLLGRVENFISSYYHHYIIDVPKVHNIGLAVNMIERLSMTHRRRVH